MLTHLVIAEILSSTTGQCPQIAKVYQSLTHVTVEDRSKPHIFTNYAVYGTRPNGKKVALDLTKTYNCDYGSFGGGGCSNHYQCSMEEEIDKSAYNCEAICIYRICDSKTGTCHEGGRNVSSNPYDVDTISADSIKGLKAECHAIAQDAVTGDSQVVSEVNLYSKTQYRVRARYLQTIWLIFDTEATVENSCSTL